jgi:glycosyltransferase involved in cell wall biosynthesis
MLRSFVTTHFRQRDGEPDFVAAGAQGPLSGVTTDTPLILFEPICRGSRLQWVANIVRAVRAQSMRPIRIVTRSDYRSAHLSELLGRFADADVQFITAATDLGGAWIKILDSAEFEAFLRPLAAVAPASQPADIVFMAIDDYLAAFAKKAGWIARRFGASRISILKYRVEYLLPGFRNSWRARALALITHWAVRRVRGRFICLDERLLGRAIGRSPAAFLPDPWYGGFSPERRSGARAKHGFGDDEFVILTIGKQDKRKGLPLILDALKALLKDNKTRLLVVGAIDQALASGFAQALRDYPGRIIHVNRFVDEADLPDIFACADVFLLAYPRDFTATSGTLPRAAACGVPVVTGRHGLIGHRVREMGLGESFHIEDAAEFAAAVERVRNYTPAKLMAVKQALAMFASSASIASFESTLRALFPDSDPRVEQ